jgi:galactose mutarotase-like enzyme
MHAGDFEGRWLSSTDIVAEYTLGPHALELTVTASNSGAETLPIGIAWHPYFALPSGRRDQARLSLPALSRLEVNDYDEVLPTGRKLPLAGSAYDFTAPDGRPLGDLYLDDCFVDLTRTADGETLISILDPAAGYGLRILSCSEQVSAIQTYAPPDKPFVVVEPQFNWADPYGTAWGADADTGMVELAPGQSVTYRVRVEPFAL